MKLQAFILVLMGLTLAGCGQDVGSRGQGSKINTATPAVETATTDVVSGIARTRGIPQIRYGSEAAITTNFYHIVPDMAQDSETNTITRTSLGRPTVVCGLNPALTSISARIADCQQKNTNLASWSAQTFGTAAEADWSLVAFISEGKEIWQDQRTKAIWSPIIGKGNWCQASGNEQSPSGSVTVNCATSIPSTEASSFCVNMTIDGLADAIQWRLPTRSDYLQADVDGLRSILSSKDLDETGFWTATMDSSSNDRSKAWIYAQKQGVLTSDTLLSVHQIRCLGTTK